MDRQTSLWRKSFFLLSLPYSNSIHLLSSYDTTTNSSCIPFLTFLFSSSQYQLLHIVSLFVHLGRSPLSIFVGFRSSQVNEHSMSERINWLLWMNERTNGWFQFETAHIIDGFLACCETQSSRDSAVSQIWSRLCVYWYVTNSLLKVVAGRRPTDRSKWKPELRHVVGMRSRIHVRLWLRRSYL